MKALIIYDNTGYVWNIVYGQETIPSGLEKAAIVLDVPSDMCVSSMDLSDPDNPKPVYNEQPGTEIDRLSNEIQEVKEDVSANTTGVSTNAGDITDVQVAIAEIYEALGT